MASSSPASRIEVFDVIVPAGTTKAAPAETDTGFLPGELVGVDVIIPDGHLGFTGFRIALAHSPVIPHTAGAWIVGNDDRLSWDTVGYPNSGAYSVFAYNEDIFPHTFHVRFLVLDFPYTMPAPVAPPVATPTFS